MHRIITILCALILSLSLAACGTKTYNVSTKSGKSYTSYGSPQLNVKAKTYTLKDADGKEIIVNQDDVEVIQQTK